MSCCDSDRAWQQVPRHSCEEIVSARRIVRLTAQSSVRYRTKRNGVPLGYEALVGSSCGCIASAGLRFECLAIDDGQYAAHVLDHAFALERTRRRCDTH